jgi:hypothetical protein
VIQTWNKKKIHMLPIPFTYCMLELCGFCLFEQEANWILGFLRNIYGRNSAHLPAFQEINVEVSLVTASLVFLIITVTSGHFISRD